MNKNINVQKIIEACDTAARRIAIVEGGAHGSVFLFDNSMRAFTAKLPAEAVTFSVHFAYPVNKDGFVTIHRDGTLNCATAEGLQKAGLM